MGEMKQMKGGFMALPPHPDNCQVCATKHEPEMPHNVQSLYYQFMFNDGHGRSATWKDAWAHCTREVIQKWISGFHKLIRDGKLCIQADDLKTGHQALPLASLMDKITPDYSSNGTRSFRIDHKFFYYTNGSWDSSDKLPAGMVAIKLDDLC